MQLNTTTDYAIRLLVYLAKVDRVASSQEIAAAMRIPQKYITTIAAKLKDAEIISTMQGSVGSYSLNRDSSEITLREIVFVIEGGIRINRCTICSPDCILYSDENCSLNTAYQDIRELIENAFGNISINELLKLNNEN